MRDSDLFTLALGLAHPWFVENCSFDPKAKQLDIFIDFEKGGEFSCPVCGKGGCKAYDSENKTWRHLNFFEHMTYLHGRTPRVNCPDCGVKTVSVPWARSGSGFTLLFEGFVMALAKEMPVNAIARILNEHDTRVWRILNHYVDQARAQQDYSEVCKIGMDETSSKKGHHYISLFVDMARSKALFATEGKDAETVRAFCRDLEAHHGNPEQIQEACCDMSPAFIGGIGENLKNASITFDKFHVMKIINKAVDEVRREEQKSRPELVKTRFVWLKNPENLTEKQRTALETLTLPNRRLKTARAFNIRLTFQELFDQPVELAEGFLRKWYFWATHSRLEPIIRAAKTVKNHWDGILRWFESRITNGVLEGINSLIQAAKAKARGYRSTKNLITMVYLVAGKLDFHPLTHTK